MWGKETEGREEKRKRKEGGTGRREKEVGRERNGR
jgi:hypothetical protein